MKTIMAIGAHIGDVELTCGPTLAHQSAQGDKIITVALSAGERGAPPTIPVPEFKQKNLDAAAGFARALGGTFVSLGYADGEVPDDDAARFALCDVIREHKPDVVLTHWQESLHKDHTTCARIVKDAVYYAAMSDIARALPAHRAGSLYYAENWEDATDFVPYLYVDVTQGFELWHEEIQKLWLTCNSPWFRYLQFYDGLSRMRGALANTERACCFAVDAHSKKVVQKSL